MHDANLSEICIYNRFKQNKNSTRNKNRKRKSSKFIISLQNKYCFLSQTTLLHYVYVVQLLLTIHFYKKEK